MANPILCPCGTAKNYQDCCGVYHQNPGSAPTAEALMRSRYSAFARNDIDYIQATQRLCEDTSESDTQAIKEENSATKWLELTILDCQQGQVTDDTGSVTFCARFVEGSQQGELTEKSLFEKRNDQWFYVSGSHEVSTAPPVKAPIENHKVGRNDPCVCGSGKKYKKCCG
ncbi:YchJ family protein [Marinomonas pollencensis]|uniref:SEC-C motif-containing protein n=1 Tax=Marinomonas pollencensis TaxID=491954 RepID=A0A3E0DGG4_9GAMM|nr:YchJ family protein [Marinomonas pollencensis]REG81820.1 SEC-C motif-containing protein [Marinomonas pollencensis]